MNTQNNKVIEDIQKFTRVIERGLQIQAKNDIKPIKIVSKTDISKMIKQAVQKKKADLTLLKKELKHHKPKKVLIVKEKKWREKDKSHLLNKVRDKYISIMKMRINLELFDPMIAENKRYKREVKRLQKEQQKRQEIQVKDEVQTI